MLTLTANELAINGTGSHSMTMCSLYVHKQRTFMGLRYK